MGKNRSWVREYAKRKGNVSSISLPTTSLKIDEKTYSLCSVICHHRESLHKFRKKPNLWFRCNDVSINKVVLKTFI